MSDFTSPPERRYIPLAEIARPHGVHGELRLRVFNDDSQLLLRRPPVRLRLPDGSEREARLEATRPGPKALLVRLAGVDDRDAAEALRGAVVCVSRDLFPPADEGEFYACDIEGAEVVTTEGARIGKVTGLVSYPSCDALVVVLDGPPRDGPALDGPALDGPPAKGQKPRVVEVPLVDNYIASVDVARKTVTVVTLEGLL